MLQPFTPCPRLPFKTNTRETAAPSKYLKKSLDREVKIIPLYGWKHNTGIAEIIKTVRYFPLVAPRATRYCPSRIGAAPGSRRPTRKIMPSLRRASRSRGLSRSPSKHLRLATTVMVTRGVQRHTMDNSSMISLYRNWTRIRLKRFLIQDSAKDRNTRRGAKSWVKPAWWKTVPPIT